MAQIGGPSRRPLVLLLVAAPGWIVLGVIRSPMPAGNGLAAPLALVPAQVLSRRAVGSSHSPRVSSPLCSTHSAERSMIRSRAFNV
jgi:hypothetical protein